MHYLEKELYERRRTDNVLFEFLRYREMVIRDEAGQPIRMLEAHTDLTDAMRTKEELAQHYAEIQQKADALVDPPFANRVLAFFVLLHFNSYRWQR